MKRFADGAVVDGATDYSPFGTPCPARYPDGRVCGEIARSNGSHPVTERIVERNMICPRGHTFVALGPPTPLAGRRARRKRRVGIMRL